MIKIPLNADPVVSDGLAANDDIYIPANRERPVLTVLDGRGFFYLDYALAVQRGKKTAGPSLRAGFQYVGSWNPAILDRNRTQPCRTHVESTKNEPPTTNYGC